MATPTRFNTGRWMALPFQSSYADLRQRLIANPGVALSTVFRESFGHNQFLRNYSPKKHCPECAKSLYHNTLFDYCWLQRCPVHGRPLQSYCELCGGAWPRGWNGSSSRKMPGFTKNCSHHLSECSAFLMTQPLKIRPLQAVLKPSTFVTHICGRQTYDTLGRAALLKPVRRFQLFNWPPPPATRNPSSKSWVWCSLNSLQSASQRHYAA